MPTGSSWNNELSLTAGGNLAPASFAKLDTAADEQCLQAGAGDTPIGITTEDQERAPGLAGSDTTIGVSTGRNVRIKSTGNDCLLTIGAAVVRGAYLKPDASGFGVTASSTNVVGALALQSGSASGAKIRVLVLPPGSKAP